MEKYRQSMEEDWKKHGKRVEKEGRYFLNICADCKRVIN